MASDTSAGFWSNSNPNAPRISHELYFSEKAYFAGDLLAAVFYGVVIALFFQCMTALLNPVDRPREGIRWGLVAHTMAMFVFVTINTATGLNCVSVANVNNRDFRGELLPPGPSGYKDSVYRGLIGDTPRITLTLNQLLADGLLLYRCYIIYAKSRWAIAFPFLMYIASGVTGIIRICTDALDPSCSSPLGCIYNNSYFAVTLSLNVLLTLLIVARLILHTKNVKSAMGTPTVSGGVYKTVISILVESLALYSLSLVLALGPLFSKSTVTNIFSPPINETQVIAPFLITLRVAKQRMLGGDKSTPEGVGTLQFKTQGESTVSKETLPDNHLACSTDVRGEVVGELGVGSLSATEEIP